MVVGVLVVSAILFLFYFHSVVYLEFTSAATLFVLIYSTVYFYYLESKIIITGIISVNIIFNINTLYNVCHTIHTKY